MHKEMPYTENRQTRRAFVKRLGLTFGGSALIISGIVMRNKHINREIEINRQAEREASTRDIPPQDKNYDAAFKKAYSDIRENTLFSFENERIIDDSITLTGTTMAALGILKTTT